MQPHGSPFVRLGRGSIFGYEMDDSLQDGSGSSCPWRKVKKCCEEPTIQFNRHIKVEVIDKISNFLDGRLVGLGPQSSTW